MEYSQAFEYFSEQIFTKSINPFFFVCLSEQWNVFHRFFDKFRFISFIFKFSNRNCFYHLKIFILLHLFLLFDISKITSVGRKRKKKHEKHSKAYTSTTMLDVLPYVPNHSLNLVKGLMIINLLYDFEQIPNSGFLLFRATLIKLKFYWRAFRIALYQRQ